MFEIGLTEIIVVVIIGCLVLDIKDIPAIIKWTKRAMNHFYDFINEIKKIFTEIDQETKAVKRTIIDLEGKSQVAYDLDDITPDIKKPVLNNASGVIPGKPRSGATGDLRKFPSQDPRSSAPASARASAWPPSSGMTHVNNANDEIKNDKK